MKSLNFFAFSLLLLLAACGGGTTGTGTSSGDAIVHGKVITSRGFPILGIEVFVEETGASAAVDEKGHFSLETELEADTVTLVIHTVLGDTVIQLIDIPEGNPIIHLVIEYNEKFGVAFVRDIKIELDGSTKVGRAIYP